MADNDDTHADDDPHAEVQIDGESLAAMAMEADDEEALYVPRRAIQSDGRITIPKDDRERLGLGGGHTCDVILVPTED